MSLYDASEEAGTPASPTSGRRLLYPKATGWYTKNSAGSEVEILTAASATSTATTKLPDIDVVQATGALTVALNTAIYQDFRSTTATDGTPSTVLCDPADLVIPDGATLGSVTTVAADIVVLMLNNAGTVEFAVVNLAGGVNLDGSGVISTTAIGTGSDSANVVYSTTARTNLAYKVVKRFRAVNTAGSWAGPTDVADIDSATMSSLGYGQTWQSVTRTSGVTYYNTTGKPICVSASGGATAVLTISANGFTVYNVASLSAGSYPAGTAIIPPGASYIITHTSGTIVELR